MKQLGTAALIASLCLAVWTAMGSLRFYQSWQENRSREVSIDVWGESVEGEPIGVAGLVGTCRFNPTYSTVACYAPLLVQDVLNTIKHDAASEG